MVMSFSHVHDIDVVLLIDSQVSSNLCAYNDKSNPLTF